MWHRIAVLALGLLLAAAGGAKADLIGVSFNSSGSGPTDWNDVSSTSQSPDNNLVTDNGTATQVSLTFSGNNEHFSSSSLDSSTVPSYANDLSKLAGNTYTYAATTETFTATFSGLVANQPYDVYFFSARFGAGNVGQDQEVTISGGGTPVTFEQQGSANQLAINGQVGSSSQTLQSYAILVDASSSGTITFSSTSIARTNGYLVSGLAVSGEFPMASVAEPSSGVVAALGAVGLLLYGRARRAGRSPRPRSFGG